MAQSNAMQDQPSMEDILTSIRRIIDDSSVKPPNTKVPGSDEIANDDSIDALPMPPGQAPAATDDSTSGQAIDEIPELDSFLEALDAKYTAQQAVDTSNEPAAGAERAQRAETKPGEDSRDAENSSIALIDEAMASNQASARDNSKYEARFSEDDRTAFAAVGDVLAANTAQQEKSTDIGALNSDNRSKTLISEPTRARVGGSLNSLSDALAQEAQRQLPAMTESMLKPMLADWLDNNLPSLVERLVREEIERIARGD